MSPPEVWGPAVWTLFHTLAEKLNPNAYNQVIPSFFGIILQICRVLPCPDCSRDASNFLAKIKLSDYKTKDEFKNMLYLFHNYVNAKKRKPLYNYANMDKYSKMNIIFVVNNFISKYNTRGNMKLLTESFQRSFVIKNFISWFNGYKLAFTTPTQINLPQQVEPEQPLPKNSTKEVLTTIEEVSSEEPVIEEPVTEEPVTEEPVTEEPVIEEPVIEEPVIEEPVIEEPVTEEPVTEEPVIEEPVTEEPVIEEPVTEEPVTEEPVTEEPVTEEPVIEEPVKSKKGRKSKSKK
jgi:hypothetical protein